MTGSALRVGFTTLTLALILSCATTGTVSDRAFLYESKSVAWQAAVRAMRDVGAKIVTSNESAGMLTGTVNMVELGGRVRLDVSVRHSAGGSELENTGTDVDVSVVLEGRRNDDSALREDLARIRDAYIEAVKQHALAMGPRVRR